ncbi:MAG: class B sortase, partial [Ruminiclostridium sp.]|nr:class B sortase [Ruminiclostridium sp.]
MAVSYLVKAPRKNGEAQKKPNLIKRAAMFFIPWKGDGAVDVIRKLIFIISLIAFIVTAFPLLSDIYTMYRDEWVNKQLQNIYNPDVNGGGVRNEAGILPSFEQLLDINPDTVGYLKIPGTAIDYPVVKSEDNDYYLFRDFYGNPNKSGTVMMDHKNVVSADKTSANLVLYGHNMAIGTFFAGLGEYWRTLYDSYDGASIAYYKEHPTIIFDTLYEQAEWKIFAIGLYNVDEQ